MRGMLAVAVCWSLLIAACGTATDDAGISTTTAQFVTTGTATATTASNPSISTISSSTSPSVSTSTMVLPSTTTSIPAEAVGGPDYIVTGPEGVFRVVDRVATLVVDRTDVMWAADDGMGGIVFYGEPGMVEHLRAGTTTPEVIATNAWPNYVTLLEGKPTLEISQIPSDPCDEVYVDRTLQTMDDGDGQHAVLVDLESGEVRTFLPCIALESSGVHPQSIGGDLVVSVVGGGWPEAAPIWGSLVFRDLDGSEVSVSANPWPDPCPWCAITPLLSPDGAVLALSEYVPQPSDLGAADWNDFEASDIGEQWSVWEEARMVGGVRLRTIDLNTGDTVYSDMWPGPGWVIDFDGHYLVYMYGGVDGHNQYTLSAHLIDTYTGDEIPINWGVADPGAEPREIRLTLP